jgi:hypothetical protein
MFEFPLFKQLFYETDTELRPTARNKEFNFILAENSNLKKFIDVAEERVILESEYRYGYNLGKYIGKVFIVDIFNKPSKKDPAIVYNNIGMIRPASEHIRQSYSFDWEKVVKFNEPNAFLIDDAGTCWNSEAWKKVPPKIREQIKRCDEAQAHLQRGGMIWDKSNENSEAPVKREPSVQKPTIPSAPAPAPIPTTGNVQMIATDYTYEQYIASGWTEEQLVANGKAKRIGKEAPAAPPLPPVQEVIEPQDTMPEIKMPDISDDDMPF